MEKNFLQEILHDIFRFFTNRLLIIAVLMGFAFYYLTTILFDLQIVNGSHYVDNLQFTSLKKLPIQAPRGTIYDKFGRPLAVNESAFTVKFDPSVQTGNVNETVSNLVKLFEKNKQEYVVDYPISETAPYVFTFEESGFREERWRADMEVKAGLTAEESILYLRDKFKISEDLPIDEVRKLLPLRSLIYMQRFRQYNPITIAYNVNTKTIVELEEENAKYPGVYVDTQELRKYPESIYFSHILGYLRNITEEQLEDFKSKGHTDYTNSEIVGRAGLELHFEFDLNGVNGEMQVEINNTGRRVRTVEVKQPKQGDKLFLTVDAHLQKKVYEILKNRLRDVLKNKLKGVSSKELPITQNQLFASMIKSYNISSKMIMESSPGTSSYNVRNYVLSVLPQAKIDDDKSVKQVNEAIAEGIEQDKISNVEMLLIMVEQKIITADYDLLENIKSGKISTLQVILQKMDEDEITPQMTNLDPCTGSVVVLDVNTGDVLATVSYPSYDNNELVNNFNNEYYNKIMNYDPTIPFLNRPFTEPRAPGSTFKMITAIAGLERGAITPSTKFHDDVVFEKAGHPVTRCWSAYSHGTIDVREALEVSCNYFFCEVAYRLGNSKGGNKLDSIYTLNEVMEEFGLNDNTGVEIGELRDQYKREVTPKIISSPEFKRFIELRFNKNAPPSTLEWYDGDNVRTAIGQSKNDYTAASMAKYIATLASGGTRYQMHLMDKLMTQDGKLVKQFEPVVERKINLKPETLEAVYDGMEQVVKGKRGTAAAVFKDFPVSVIGKTGTAQQIPSRNDHSSFGGFAPFSDKEKPQIAIYVMLPYGDTKSTPAAASVVARDVIAEYMEINSTPQHLETNNSLAK